MEHPASGRGGSPDPARSRAPTRICIVTRFSILVDGNVHSWRKLRSPLDPRTWTRPKQPTLAEKRAYLFAPKRLDARFARFEALLLPSVAAQTRAAEHIVLASTLLPPPWRDRLEGLARERGFRLHFAGTERVVDRVLVEDGLIGLDGRTRLATIRVDDDDAIATTLVERVARLSRLDLDDYVVSFPRGVYLDQRRAKAVFAPVVQPNVACGLTRVLRKRRKALSVYGLGNHNALHARLPVVSAPDSDMYLMTTHDDNVSNRLAFRRLKDAEPLTPEAAARLEARFGVRLTGA